MSPVRLKVRRTPVLLGSIAYELAAIYAPGAVNALLVLPAAAPGGLATASCPARPTGARVIRPALLSCLGRQQWAKLP
ncbi:hypothetical protein GCM10010201_29420 [Pilimelia columellifera subsp. columellifera]|uniref:Uncharacterized protein n=1 Tax=Pilimelia columellifera subsp. columellifera TaxID=706583 RepID=A0ABP6B1D5_9ACTN